jgi:hypothetical protein
MRATIRNRPTDGSARRRTPVTLTSNATSRRAIRVAATLAAELAASLFAHLVYVTSFAPVTGQQRPITSFPKRPRR